MKYSSRKKIDNLKQEKEIEECLAQLERNISKNLQTVSEEDLNLFENK